LRLDARSAEQQTVVFNSLTVWMLDIATPRFNLAE
jgi:hypothetical protein